MKEKKENYEKLRRIFLLYECYLDNYIAENQISNSSYKDVLFVIANEDDKLGSILAKTISNRIMSEDLFYEGQPFIVCGRTSRSLVLAQFNFIKRRSIANKINKCLNVPVIVADDESMEVFNFILNQPIINSQ